MIRQDLIKKANQIIEAITTGESSDISTENVYLTSNKLGERAFPNPRTSSQQAANTTSHSLVMGLDCYGSTGLLMYFFRQGNRFVICRKKLEKLNYAEFGMSQALLRSITTIKPEAQIIYEEAHELDSPDTYKKKGKGTKA